MTESVIQSSAIVLSALISGYAAIKAAKAEKNSRPISNGFTSHLMTEIRDIRKLLVRHIENHDTRSNN